MRQTGNYAILRSIGVIVVLSVLADQALSYVLETPDYILPCSKSDPQINACIAKTFNHMRPYLTKGIEELNVPPLEPLSIPRLAMENGHGPVRVRAAFSNVTAYGASNYTVGDVRTDLDSWKIDLILSVPRIEANGRYEVTGNVLLFPVRSHGDFWAAFGDINALAKLQGREVEQDGMTFLRIEHIGVDFTLAKSRFKVRDFVNNKNLLGEAMNRFLNENANAIVDEMKPAASLSIGKHFAGFLNKAFSNIPVHVWLKD